MSVAVCFWALLSLENFEFIYLPSFIKNTAIASGITVGDVLLSHSLLEFIHPEELSLATTDLLNFVRIKTLAGAITRCRLRRIKSLAASDGYKKEDWKVTDVVMYTAANKTILTFFHTHQVEPESYPTPSPYQSPCFYNTPLNQNDASIILQTLQKYSSTIEDPLRLFQIYNTVNKKLVFQWPTKAAVIQRLEEEFNSIPDKERCFDSILQYAINLSIEEIDKQTHVTRSSGTDCTHHSHSNSVAFLEPCGVCQIEKIIITYGSLTFSSFQVTPIDTQFYHQHLNRIPSTSPSTTATTITTSTINNNDKSVANNSNNYEKFMKSSFLGETSPPLVSLPPISSPTKPSSTTSSTSSTKTTTNTTTERKKSPPSSSKNSNKLTLPKAWKTRFGVTEKKCENCSTNKSPEWRRGPTGHKTLCNACGLRYARLVAKREKKKSKSSDEDDEDFNNKKTKKP